MEDEEVLRTTLDNLACHPLAAQYLIVMAMESREQGAARKAQLLLSE